MSTVLVTGAAGFIGSNVANTLSDAGADVHALDNEYLGTPENLDDAVTYHQASVLDDDLPVQGVDAVVHLAALSSRNMLEENPQEGARVNIEGFVNVVEQAHAAGCDNIVYASTSSFYDDDLPSVETEAVGADTGYEASMLAREKYADYYNTFYDDLTVTGLRFFSVYQGYHAGNEAHKGNFANIVSQFADLIANGESPVIWGDGSQTRDFVHVEDVVAAIRAVIDERPGGVFNVGTGTNYSFNDVVALLNDALDADVEPEYEPVQIKHYNAQQRADASKLRDVTGWEPSVSFEEGIDRVTAPYRAD